jgi:hypothetical protein
MLMGKSATIDEAVIKLIAAASEDRAAFSRWPFELMGKSIPDSVHEKAAAWAAGWEVQTGRKYIKLICPEVAAWAFIVNVDTDKKFRRGDLLKAGSWTAPERNAARGNVLDGGYEITWHGPASLRPGY